MRALCNLCASFSQVFLDSVAALTGDAGDTTDPVATFDTVQVCWGRPCNSTCLVL
jgi:hypothetical protein